jgi:hypothetical protein
MRHRSILRSSVLILVLGAVLAGCGGDDAPSKEEFAQEADKVCAKVEDRIQELDNADPDSPAEFEQLIDDIKATGNAGVAQLKDLERPDGDTGEQAEQFVTATTREWEQQGVPALDELVEAVRSKDEVALRAAGRKLDALENSPSEKIATQLGADECAEG